MRQIQTEIVINAAASQVWDILTNFEAYSDWNPFIVNSSGEAIAGQKLENTMVNGDSTVIFRPTVLEVREGEYVDWLGNLWVNGIFDGHHYFELQAISATQTKLIHGERFRGILVRLLWNKIGESTRQHFINMNQALKAKAEQSVTAS